MNQARSMMGAAPRTTSEERVPRRTTDPALESDKGPWLYLTAPVSFVAVLLIIVKLSLSSF